ncbi:MAG: hypothetical protein J5746_00990, partial [Victivallales bacterium]|nr:hypothetical protein [Victivallales bacterium]
MNKDGLMIFKWTSFFNRWGQFLDPRKKSPKDWQPNLGSPEEDAPWEKAYKTSDLNMRYKGELPCVRFLALACWDGKNEGNGNLSDVDELAQQLGFQYNYFTTNRKLLCKQLKSIFRIDLLSAQNGDKQYLRTLQIYSGKMYIRFASAVATVIRRSGEWERWLKEGELESQPELRNLASRYIPNNNGDDKVSLQEIADFFRKLIQLHLDRKTEFTVPDIQQYAPVTDVVAEKIIVKLEDEEAEGAAHAKVPGRHKLAEHKLAEVET